MATRNRTAAFLKYRDALRQTRPAAVLAGSSDGGAGHVAIDMHPGGKKKGGYVQLTRIDSERYALADVVGHAQSPSYAKPAESSHEDFRISLS